MKFSRLSWGVLLVCLLGPLACRSGNSTGESGTKTLKLAFVTTNSADFWPIARLGVD